MAFARRWTVHDRWRARFRDASGDLKIASSGVAIIRLQDHPKGIGKSFAFSIRTTAGDFETDSIQRKTCDKIKLSCDQLDKRDELPTGVQHEV